MFSGIRFYRYYIGDCVVVQRLSLSPDSKKALGSVPEWGGPFCEELASSPRV